MGNTTSVNYLIKVDELQIDRIQQLHHIFKYWCNDTNYFSPISKDLAHGIEVLDIGRSGPGTWIFDMSSDYPKSKFTGIEIEPSMLPTIHPFNTRLIYHNVLDGIPFYPNSFDYIHMRCMILCFTDLQYEQIIKESVELLKPNGYLELCEGELSLHNMGPISKRIFNSLGKLLRNRSMNPFISNRLHEFLAKYELRQIKKEEVMMSLSPVNGKIGKLTGQNFYYILYGLKDILAKHMKLSNSEIIQLIDGFLEETKTYQMYCKYTRVYGRKIVEG
ncbi:S-adenosyl-L-methionine-dependent methyltransferase [Glomus cerebriforme]|uniref:S-adenosyl-L-methionine-dependent methyltransferase n=1 Tax=Glomus cerebriforme TaxID=658196 RepID=A0A397TRP7_9GLOM|nr:S-adenosyl-L-methionine-dependent methyltransferase [Glomus cerebriforme]